MGYYIRVLGTDLAEIPIDELRKSAAPALIEVGEQDDSERWTQLLLKHANGPEIAVIERNEVVEGKLGADELQEFVEEVGNYKPSSAATWLKAYFPRVKVIYAFQLLSGTDVQDGWDLVHSVYSKIWNKAGGILQADGEGFSDEEGYTVLWQFSETVTGPWNVGVLGNDGNWVHFPIDLGNRSHREAFQNGEVPKGIKPE